MSWRKDQGRAERGYHHGNLKEALLQAALDMISKKGPAGFTFADAARMAGVSPAAPPTPTASSENSVRHARRSRPNRFQYVGPDRPPHG